MKNSHSNLYLSQNSNSHQRFTSPNYHSARTNLRLVIAESSITAGTMAMSIITPFFNSIGLNNQQIAEVQICFTVVLALLNVPMGYIADRLGRKWANVFGDFVHALFFLAYSRVATMGGAIICECLCGIASALSDGVDQSLLKHFADKISQQTHEPSFQIIKSETAKLEICKQICNLVLLALGGPIGAISLRLTLALSSVNYFLGGFLSLFIQDDSERLRPNHPNPFRDMYAIVKDAIKYRPLRIRILAYAIGREITHGVIWIATPLFLKAGLPMEVVSLVWVFNALMCIVGAKLSARFSKNLQDYQLLIVPLILMTIGLLTLSFSLNPITVWLYGVTGLTQGWTATSLIPMIQKYAKPSAQTSILSVTKTFAQLLYIPSVWLICRLADIQLSYGLFTALVIFVPLGLIIIGPLKQNV